MIALASVLYPQAIGRKGEDRSSSPYVTTVSFLDDVNGSFTELVDL